jgi:hypothetical protein
MYLNFDVTKTPINEVDMLKEVEAAKEVDWRTKGAVTPVKN